MIMLLASNHYIEVMECYKLVYTHDIRLTVPLFPMYRAPPLWGAMKHFHQKIPDTASKKSQLYGYLLDQEKYATILSFHPL